MTDPHRVELSNKMKWLLSLTAVFLVFIIGFACWYVLSSENVFNKVSILETATEASEAKTVVAVGDMVCDPTDLHRLVKSLGFCQDGAVYNLASSLKPDAFLALGDLQYDNGALAKYKSLYDKNWGKLKFITYPTPGNHEYLTPNATGYFNYFNESRPTGRAGSPDKSYYSFNLGGWHIISLNSNCAYINGCGKKSPQLTWLRSDLQKNKLACVAAFWHHPRFTSGTYSEDEASANLSGDFWNELSTYQAEIVLNGHDHIYERFAPQSPSGQPDPQGTRQFTVGTGGKALYKKKTAAPNSQIALDNSFGVLKLELYTKAYRWQFISTQNKVLDSGYGQCGV